ncbi:MAG: hypothetical protein FIB00_00870 [Chloroflexi bacterium]|nr:hypothetical protein [Chloroflexota bacterium]
MTEPPPEQRSRNGGTCRGWSSSFEVYASASPLFDRDVLGITVDSALAARDIPAGRRPGRCVWPPHSSEARWSSG